MIESCPVCPKILDDRRDGTMPTLISKIQRMEATGCKWFRRFTINLFFCISCGDNMKVDDKVIASYVAVDYGTT